MRDVAEKVDLSLDVDDWTLGLAAGQVILKLIQGDLEKFGIKPFDSWYSEKSLHESDKISQALSLLEANDLVYEQDGAKWFRSSALGDDKDRVVVKSDGSLTYLAADIAFHHIKYEDNVDALIDIWGADHHGYVARIKAAIKAMGHDSESFTALLCQLVRLTRDGEVVQMSTRSGEFVTLAEIIDEVGKDVARYYFLMRKFDSHLDFDIEQAKKQSMDNPVYYVQYAYARICSVKRVFDQEGLKPVAVDQLNLSCLTNTHELHLLKTMTAFKELIEMAVKSNEPHRITNYLRDLAAAFHSFYRECRIVTDDKELTQARYYLVSGAQIVLGNGLSLLGISARESM